MQQEISRLKRGSSFPTSSESEDRYSVSSRVKRPQVLKDYFCKTVCRKTIFANAWKKQLRHCLEKKKSLHAWRIGLKITKQTSRHLTVSKNESSYIWRTELFLIARLRSEAEEKKKALDAKDHELGRQFSICGLYSRFRILRSTIESRCSRERRTDREFEKRNQYCSTQS